MVSVFGILMLLSIIFSYHFLKLSAFSTSIRSCRFVFGDANIAAKTTATSYSTYKTSEGITSPSNTSKQGATSANIEAKTSYKYYNNNSSISDVAASVEEENINAGLNEPIPILYSDDDIIVVNKPAFAQTAPGYLEKDCAAARIADIFGISRIDQMIAHRLDYATSGVVIFARNPDALKSLHNQFRTGGQIYKEYAAIVQGRVSSWEGEIELPLGRDLERGPPFCTVLPPEETSILGVASPPKSKYTRGKYSLTHWTAESIGSSCSLLRLIPKTGRTHQLRVHLAAIGHPILGDLFYAPPEAFQRSRRLLLHARELRLRHPRSGADMRFRAEDPFSIESF